MARAITTPSRTPQRMTPAVNSNISMELPANRGVSRLMGGMQLRQTSSSSWSTTMYSSVHTAGPSNSIAVTYLCPSNHADIRFYRVPPVPRQIVCAHCGWPGVITTQERKRHVRLHDSLKEWLA